MLQRCVQRHRCNFRNRKRRRTTSSIGQRLRNINVRSCKANCNNCNNCNNVANAMQAICEPSSGSLGFDSWRGTVEVKRHHTALIGHPSHRFASLSTAHAGIDTCNIGAKLKCKPFVASILFNAVESGMHIWFFHCPPNSAKKNRHSRQKQAKSAKGCQCHMLLLMQSSRHSVPIREMQSSD